MYRRHVCLQYLLITVLLTAGSKSVAGGDCSETFDGLALDPNKLPAVDTTESLYKCFGIAEHLRGFDRLERDLVIMDAMNNSWPQFRQSEVSGRDKTYGEQFPIERLREFHTFIRRHTKH